MPHNEPIRKLYMLIQERIGTKQSYDTKFDYHEREIGSPVSNQLGKGKIQVRNVLDCRQCIKQKSRPKCRRRNVLRREKGKKAKLCERQASTKVCNVEQVGPNKISRLY